MNTAQNTLNQGFVSFDWAAVFSLSQLRTISTASLTNFLTGVGESALWGMGAKLLYYGSKAAVQTVVAEGNFVGGYAQCASLGMVHE